jgi:type IV fimbrial biogenesis protein FimT
MGERRLLHHAQGGQLLMRQAAGFTLIELMITIAIGAILIVIGVPTMRGVIENGRIRAAGESWKYGLALARTEAIRRNTQVEFVSDADGWQVLTVADGTVLHQAAGNEGAADLEFTIVDAGGADADRVTFNSLGRIVDPNPSDGSEPIAQVDLGSTNVPGVAGYHPLRLQVTAGGMTRLCDPAVASTDPRACL